jgi:hypothetical protein
MNFMMQSMGPFARHLLPLDGKEIRESHMDAMFKDYKNLKE